MSVFLFNSEAITRSRLRPLERRYVMANIPIGYQELEGSRRRVRKGAERVGPADPKEKLLISIYVRRQPGAPSLPSQKHFAATQPGHRETLSRAELARTHGASAEDLKVVTDFAEASGLKVVHTDAARRLVQVSGTVAQFSKALHVELALYRSATEGYRGREGAVNLPAAVAAVVEGVFGLDNRRMARRMGKAAAAPPVTPPRVAQAYNFPTPANGAAGQTIAILEFSGPTTSPLSYPTCGFAQSDIDGFIKYLNTTNGSNLVSTNVKSVAVDKTAAAPGNLPGGSASKFTLGDHDLEVHLDIEVVVSVAQNANVVVYFAPITEQGWVDAITQIVADTANDPSVLSISWGWSELEADMDLDLHQPEPLPFEWTQQAFNKMTEAFQSAAAIGMTVLAGTGDEGSDCGEQDGNAHVNYPASDPWVVSCGGTTIKQLAPLAEDTWNDNQVAKGAGGGATGGGISYLADPVSWQANANVPVSVNADHHKGRGIPDVAGNAGGYDLWLYGKPLSKLKLTSGPGKGQPFGAFGGTSSVAPLYAALIGLINASLNKRVGYLNPTLYGLAGKGVFRDINDGGTNAISWTNPDGSVGGPSLGYKSGPGWDACTGWGSIHGNALLTALGGQVDQAGVAKGAQAHAVGRT
jgi:kumamolisin